VVAIGLARARYVKRGAGDYHLNIRRLTNKYREVQQLVQRGRGMSFDDKSRLSVDRKTSRNLDFLRNRGVEEMGPTTRAIAKKSDADPGSGGTLRR